MLVDALAFRNALDTFVDKNPKLKDSRLHLFEWDEVASFVKFLEPFKEITLDLFSKERNTLSSVLPLMEDLKTHLAKHSESTHLEIERAAKVMAEKLDIYWNRINIAEIQSATLLDPRIKSELLSPEQETQAVEHIKKLIKHKVVTRGAEQVQATKRMSALDKLLAKKRTAGARGTASSSSESVDGASVERYLESGAIPTELSPVIWWNKNATQFNELSLVAFDLLAISATAIATEQLNSQGRLLIAYTRSRISAELVEACVCLKMWNRLLDRLQEAGKSETDDDDEDEEYDPFETDSEDEDDVYEEALYNQN